MRLAWLSSSEKTTWPRPTSAETVPRFVRYPEPKSNAASYPAKSASRRSSRSWMDMFPEISREAPAPAPKRSAASAAAWRTRGWSASPTEGADHLLVRDADDPLRGLEGLEAELRAQLLDRGVRRLDVELDSAGQRRRCIEVA